MAGRRIRWIGEQAMDVMIANAKQASSVLKALANVNRLNILCCLIDGEKNVGELEAALGIRQPTLSQQLSRLRDHGLVKTRRDSKRVYYSVASEEAESIIELLCKIYGAKASANGHEGEATPSILGVAMPSWSGNLLDTRFW